MAMLNAFLDDSKSDGEVLILAGFISTTERWSAFAEQWEDLLQGPPTWNRFKMSEIAYEQRDDKNWTRVKRHYDVIKAHVMSDICVAVPITTVMKVAEEFGAGPRFRNPYYMAFHALLGGCISSCKKAGIEEPIHFVFDKQNEQKRIEKTWHRILDDVPHRIRKFLVEKPSFEEDDKLMPLQAADMLAWWLRHHYLKARTVFDLMSPFPWETGEVTLRPNPH